MGREGLQPTIDARHRTLLESEMVEVLLLAGWAFEVEAGGRGPAEASTRAALEAWIDLGLGYGLDAERRRLFDPVEVVNFLKWAGLTGQDRFWADRYVATGRALVEALRASAAARFRVTLERTFNLRRFALGAPVRLRLPLPLRGPDAADLDIEPAADSEAKVILRADHLEARLRAPPSGSVKICVRSTFTPAASDSDNLSLQDRNLYLRPTEGLIQVTPRLVDLAETLAGHESEPPKAIAVFWAHLLDGLVCGAIRYSDLKGVSPMDWVPDHGWYDCQLGSALLASLCRARGIPARLVGGHLLYRLAPTNHFWCEIWLEGLGWRSYDLLCWDLSQGGNDAFWRDRFAGTVDARMVTQRLPLMFTGPMSVRFPAAWQMVQRRGAGGGIDIGYRDIDDGSLIYNDHVDVIGIANPAPTRSVR